MKIKNISWSVVLFFIVCSYGLSYSQVGGKAGAFLRFGLGSRAKSMGNAFTALAQGVEASYYNPAGLPFLPHKQIIASYRPLSLDRQFSYLGFGMPIQPKVAGASGQKALNGGFALSWIRAGIGNIDGRDSDGEHFDDISNSENAFMFAFALNPTPKLAIGLAVKVLWNRFPSLGINDETISANGVGFDFGLIYLPREWLRLGIVFKEINAKYRWNTEDLYGGDDGSETINYLPKSVRYGLSANLKQFYDITLVFDYEQLYNTKVFKNKIDDRFHAGLEKVFEKRIAIRAGFDDGALTLGGGYDFPLFGKTSQLNYAYITPGDRPEEEHIFTWVFQF